jgi:methyl-accepting chemotaxis protein
MSSISDISKIDAEKAFEKSEDQHIEKVVEINSVSYMFETARLVLKDSSESKIMLLAPIGHNENLFQEFIVVSILTYIISFIAVNIIMTYGLSKRFLNPITSLKNAASEISSGNLNCGDIMSQVECGGVLRCKEIHGNVECEGDVIYEK